MIQLKTKIHVGPNLRRFIEDGGMLMMQVEDCTDGDATIAITPVGGANSEVVQRVFDAAMLFLEISNRENRQVSQQDERLAPALPHVESEFEQMRERIPGEIPGRSIQNMYPSTPRGPQEVSSQGDMTTLAGSSGNQPAQQYHQSVSQSPQPARPSQQYTPQQNPPLQSQTQWYIFANGQQAGPYPAQAIQQYVAAQQISPQTMMWKQGMQGWIEAGRVPELQNLFASAGPPPPPPQGFPPPPPGSPGQYPGQSFPNQPPAPVACITSAEELSQELAALGQVPDIDMDRQLSRQEIEILDQVKLKKPAYVVSTKGQILVDDIGIAIDATYPTNLSSIYPGRLIRSHHLRRCLQDGTLKFVSAEKAVEISQSVDNVDVASGLPTFQGRAAAYKQPYMVTAMGTVLPDQELMGSPAPNPADYGIVMAGEEDWRMLDDTMNIQDVDEHYTSEQAKLFSVAGQDRAQFDENMQLVQSNSGAHNGYVSKTQRKVGRRDY